MVQFTPRRLSQRPKFPNSIREYRLKAGLSQGQLARLVGRGRCAVSLWERGLRLPSIPKALRLARELGTLTETLYYDFYVRRPKEPVNSPRR
jgi:transcriptional regulator with XRE-family HTH domain